MNAPPLLVSFSDLEVFLRALGDDLESSYNLKIRQLVERGLPPAVSVRVLACLFGFSPNFVSSMVMRPEKYYREFTIRAGSKTRNIQAPRVCLKVIQKWLSYHLSRSIPPHEAAFGFISGRSSLMAAGKHCKANWVYSVDIENFFRSTSLKIVEEGLESIGYDDRSASLIARLCCYQGYLAQGSPASPVLSNIVFKAYDSRLDELARVFGVVYTRYADDIVFSGTGTVPEGLQAEVHRIFDSSEWKLSHSKEKLSIEPQRLRVHGLLVHGSVPRLTKGYRNRIRAVRHLLKCEKVRESDIEKFQGHIAYAKSVEGYKPD